MKLPRDLSGEELIRALRRFGYQTTRQTGSHIRVTSNLKGNEHHVPIPAHKQLRIGTLAEILGGRHQLSKLIERRTDQAAFRVAILWVAQTSVCAPRPRTKLHEENARRVAHVSVLHVGVFLFDSLL